MIDLILAILVMNDGARIAVPMIDMDSCVAFTRVIAMHVYSANCI